LRKRFLPSTKHTLKKKKKEEEESDDLIEHELRFEDGKKQHSCQVGPTLWPWVWFDLGFKLVRKRYLDAKTWFTTR